MLYAVTLVIFDAFLGFIRIVYEKFALSMKKPVHYFFSFSVEALIHWKLIRQMFPLHDEEYLKALGHSWYKSLSKDQPFGKFLERVHGFM